jgi:hypothetical protein
MTPLDNHEGFAFELFVIFADGAFFGGCVDRVLFCGSISVRSWRTSDEVR